VSFTAAARGERLGDMTMPLRAVLEGLAQLRPEQLEDLVEQLDEMTLEVDQPDAKVRVFCE
jgi:hypothetical protein